MEVKHLKQFVHRPEHIIKYTHMNNIVELQYLRRVNTKCSIRKLDSENYLLLKTGEVKQFQHMETRKDNIAEVKQSLKRLRAYINTNCDDVKKIKWVTLTYAENMTDPERLYHDFKKFMLRFRYKYKQYNDIQYIAAMEPQARGAWHAHVLIIFPCVAPYISNKVMSDIWGHGFTKTKKLEAVDNIGAYLTAYMTDFDIVDFKKLNGYMKNRLIHASATDFKKKNVDGKEKRIIKGARLYFYPPHFNLYRCSRGIKKPRIFHCSEEIAQERLKGAVLTYESTISLYDDESGYKNVINYRQYNKKRKK